MGLPSKGAKRRVVIIDDEPAFAEILTKFVSNLGFEVTVSTDARSSYTFALENSDIVFVDVLMPNVSGLQVLQKLARKLDLNLIGALEEPFRLQDVKDVLLGA